MGKKHSQETIDKIRRTKIGKSPWNADKNHPKYKEYINKVKLSSSMRKGKTYEQIYGIRANKLKEDKRKQLALINSHKGESHPNWKGGISSIRDRLEASIPYRNWKKTILNRDKYLCKMCGEIEYLEVHHKIPFSKILKDNNIKTVERALNCQELWNLDNGITLCKRCHCIIDFHRAKRGV